MLTFDKFRGINNIAPSERLKANELRIATDVDIDLTGGLRRRRGYSEVVAECYKNLWQADGFMLATRNGDLISRFPNGTVTTLYSGLSVARVWYCNLPDGRVSFSNGNINGITDGLTMTGWGVPVPANVGALTDVPGSLFAGDYQWMLTHVRLADNAEGGNILSNPAPITQGGILLTGLPTLAGYKTNVYLTSHNGGDGFLAGSTTGSTFTYVGENNALTTPCRTDQLIPAPAGTVQAFWRGRALVAQGSVLWASLPNRWELFDPRRDFKQFTADITLLQPVDDGIYVGTEKELAFLRGVEFDKLVYSQVVAGRAVLGSGVEVRGEQIKRGDGVGDGRAMVCIADRLLVAGFNGGAVERLTEGRYATDVAEVSATFRVEREIPQYMAVPQ